VWAVLGGRDPGAVALTSARRAKGLTQAELEAVSGVGRHTLTAIESGKRPCSALAGRMLEAALGLPDGHLTSFPVGERAKAALRKSRRRARLARTGRLVAAPRPPPRAPRPTGPEETPLARGLRLLAEDVARQVGRFKRADARALAEPDPTRRGQLVRARGRVLGKMAIKLRLLGWTFRGIGQMTGRGETVVREHHDRAVAARAAQALRDAAPLATVHALERPSVYDVAAE
jgi:transcriptional regulator with XRE-family HTH domain